MTFIDMGKTFKDAKEQPLAPEAMYDLRCTDTDHNTKEGKNTVRVTVEIEGGDFAPFSHYLALPRKDGYDEEMDVKNNKKKGTTGKNKMVMLKRFLHLFNIPFNENGFDLIDIKGATARALLGQRENEGTKYQEIRVPRMPEEA